MVILAAARVIGEGHVEGVHVYVRPFAGNTVADHVIEAVLEVAAVDADQLVAVVRTLKSVTAVPESPT